VYALQAIAYMVYTALKLSEFIDQRYKDLGNSINIARMAECIEHNQVLLEDAETGKRISQGDELNIILWAAAFWLCVE